MTRDRWTFVARRPAVSCSFKTFCASEPIVSRTRQDAFLRLIRGESRGVGASLARLGLSVIAIGYRVGVWFRNRAFDHGWKQVGRVTVPVISIGNLTLGGTGKTPMVEWVARWYRERGLRVAILSRGYGQESGANDEARVLDENLPDVPHLQDPDRLRLAEIAVEELESELLILDDGFQHRRLHRDLDIVLIDALDPFGQGRIFPRGLLREPVGSLRRADVVVLSRADLVDHERAAAIRAKAQGSRPALRWVETRHAAIGLLDASGTVEGLEGLAGKRVAAFCGIGNPEGFRRTLEPIVAGSFDFRIFPDHHAYDSADVADLGQWARSLGIELVLTTQKDFVKLRADTIGGVPLRALKIGLEILDGVDVLEEALGSILGERGA